MTVEAGPEVFQVKTLTSIFLLFALLDNTEFDDG